MSQPWLKKANALELYTIDVIMGRRAGTGAAFYGAFLQLCSWLFSGIVQLRLWLYRHRILHDQPLGCLVVVVGNLTVGGTGKTPVVEKCSRGPCATAEARSPSSAAATRARPRRCGRNGGGGSRTPRSRRRASSATASRCCSTARWPATSRSCSRATCPGVIVLVDKNRVKAGAYAIKRFGCDTLVLDDGFQYLPLKGRLNLLLVDKTNPFGNGHLLPRGILREPVKHLKRASYVFLTKSKGVRDEELEAMIQKFNPTAEIIECAHKPQYLQRIDSAERLPLTALAGRKIGALSGIAAPESFEAFLRETGAKLVYTRRFLDHYRFTHDDLGEVFSEAEDAGVEIMVTTEKDAVRIAASEKFPMPCYFLRLEIEILRGAADFQEAVGKICFPLGEPVGATNPTV
jgi:tetraacyldisaccharide 4'-kinase